MDAEVGGDPPERRWSLRREWSRAFTIMLVLLLVGAVAAIVGVRGLVDEVRGTAHQLHVESVTVSVLRTALVAHEEMAHVLLSGKPADRSVFVQQQFAISDQFDRAATIFPTDDGMRATIIRTQASWQHGLTAYGLWGVQLPSLHGNHAADNPTYGASSDATIALLDGLETPSLNAMDGGLAHGAALEQVLIYALVGLFGLALAVTVYYRTRMAKDLARPVASMHQSVLKLQAGEYDHRIEIARRDELGELAEAFNRMAAVLNDSHTALTLRATHDSLTGLPNRGALTARLTASFNPEGERRAHAESVLFIDVDDFKDVNDSLGHEGGDALLVELAARLNECVRPYDLVGRLGGDEFAIVVVENVSGAVDVAERILDAMRTPFIICGTLVVASVSIGVAHQRAETHNAAELLRDADFAMYMAKGSGKGRYELFDAKMHDNMLSRSPLG